MSTILPVIDISPLRDGSGKSRQETASLIGTACGNTGFFGIVGHQVPADLIKRTREAALGFFNAPESIKRATLRPQSKLSRGWNPPADRSLAQTLNSYAPPDLQEAYAMGPPHGGEDPYFRQGAGTKMFAPNRWPDIAGFRDTLLAYYSAMSDLARSMLHGFALALDLDAEFFDSRTDRHCSVIRLVHYLKPRGAVPHGQLRAGAHTDYGTFTFVRGDNVPGGLQVMHRDGRWIELETPEDGFICNIGDAMAYWTGERFRSTLHRVAMPPASPPVQDGRISIVFFHQPNHDAVLDGIGRPANRTSHQPAPTFAEHYLGKIRRATAE